MRRSLSTLAMLAALATALVCLDAHAQYPGGGGMGGPMGPGGGGGQPGGMGPPAKEEGPAEAAPEEAGQEPAVQPLPSYPGQHEKSLQFFQLHGYMRGRGFLFHSFNLGIPYTKNGPSPPFNPPYSEWGSSGNPSTSSGAPASCAVRENTNCTSDNLTSFDMRLRVEPVINVSEQVAVHAQIDIFDNLVAGSTPDGYYLNGLASARDVPITAFNRSQAAPEAGINSLTSSIRAKRAWAEIRTPIGELRFGRMPNHWGMGMLVNNGDCLDCDYQQNADRLMFVTKIWDHFIGLLYDWVATGPTTSLYYPNQTNFGPNYNADNVDDVSQVGLVLGRQDKPEELRERIERGDLVLNYGGYFIYRWQNWDNATNPGQNRGGVTSSPQDPSTLSANLVPRGAWAFIPDLWARLNWHKLSIEAEAAMIAGQIDNVTDISVTAKNGYNILEYGGVVRAEYKLLRDALHIQLEVGYASGDGYEDPNARINFRTAQVIYPGGATIGRFQFDPSYHVDLILWRRIIGAVNNATYFKPYVQYDLNDALSGNLGVVYSIANNPVAYPGNSMNLGVEIDAQIWYRNEEEGFYFGLMYGVLFPLGGLNLPGDIYGSAFAHDASAAQTFQGRMIVKF